MKLCLEVCGLHWYLQHLFFFLFWTGKIRHLYRLYFVIVCGSYQRPWGWITLTNGEYINYGSRWDASWNCGGETLAYVDIQIIHVEQGVHITANQVSNQDVISGDAEAYPRIRRTDIFVVDMTCDNEPAILSLYDEQTHFASMFQRGDYIGLYNPGFPPYTTESQDSRSDIIFEYTNDTILFYMSGKEAHEARCAKSDARSVPLDRSGSEASDVLSLSQWEKPVRASIAERDEEVGISSKIYPNELVCI